MKTLLWKQPQSRLVYLRDLLRVLIGRDMQLRYKRSALGIAWSLLNPLAQLLVFSLIFRFVIPLRIPNYTAFLFTGLLFWSWFQTSLLAGTGAIVDNRDLVKRPGFPALILPIVMVATNFIHLLLALPILLVFLLLNGIQLNGAALALPVVCAIQFAFTLSLVYILASVHVTFRDTQHILGILLLLGFYLSPVFYDISTIPPQYQGLYRLNPLAILIDAYRSVLIRGEWPAALPLALLSGAAVLLLWTGYQLFSRVSYRFMEEL